MKFTKTFIVIIIIGIMLILNSCIDKKETVKVSDMNQAIEAIDIDKLEGLLESESSEKLIDETMIIKAYETGNKRLVSALLAHSTINPNNVFVNTSVKYYGAKASFSNIPLNFALYFSENNIPYSILEWFYANLRYPNSLVIYKVNLMNQNAYKNPLNRYTIHVEYGAKTSSGVMVVRTFRFILDGTNYQIIEAKLSSLNIIEDIENKVWQINRSL